MKTSFNTPHSRTRRSPQRRQQITRHALSGSPNPCSLLQTLENPAQPPLTQGRCRRRWGFAGDTPQRVGISPRQRLPLLLLVGMLSNLAIAQQVYAASGGGVERGTAYAIALLGLLVVGLSAYLLVAIFQPERF